MRNIAAKVDNVDTLSAVEFNKSIMEELENSVTKSGITLDPAGGPDTSSLMLAQAITRNSQGGAIYQDSGAADAYVLGAIGGFEQPTAYTDGMSVVFKAGNTNTGASTVNVSTLGVKSIVDSAGVALTSGAISANKYYRIVYDLGNDRFELLPFDAGSTVDAQSVAQAWVNFNGTGTVAIRDSYNVSSITDAGVGLFTVNLSITMANADFATPSTVSATAVTTAVIIKARPASTTTISINTETLGSIDFDAEYNSVSVFGELA